MSSHNKTAEEALVKAFYAKRKKLTKEDLVFQLKALVKEETIEPWFRSPNPSFNGLSPDKLIELGEIQLIQDLILDMASGNPI